MKKPFKILLMMSLLLGCQAKEEEIVETNTIRRNGNSDTTFAFPDDLPTDYNYGKGRMTTSFVGVQRKLPIPQNNNTILNTTIDTANIQALYLWEQDNMPSRSTFTVDMDTYFDNYDFRPYVTAIPVKEGVEVKGAVVLLAGGAYQIRANYTDTLPTAIHLRELGFQTFIVDYRLRPYTPEEGALDVARAVRFIRDNADTYRIDPSDIAVMGYSAGGIQGGEFIINYSDNDGTSLDSRYIPDALDKVSAKVSADGMIYSFYGALSVASLDKELLSNADLPPTFYCYGTEDPFYNQFEKQYDLLQEIGVESKRIVLLDWPHGFGADGGWVEDYATWLSEIFARSH